MNKSTLPCSPFITMVPDIQNWKLARSIPCLTKWNGSGNKARFLATPWLLFKVEQQLEIRLQICIYNQQTYTSVAQSNFRKTKVMNRLQWSGGVRPSFICKTSRKMPSFMLLTRSQKSLVTKFRLLTRSESMMKTMKAGCMEHVGWTQLIKSACGGFSSLFCPIG